MADEPEEVTGRAKGGIARRDALSEGRRSEIAAKAARARWLKDIPAATHEGALALGDMSMPCAVLADGRRVLTQMGVMRAIGRGRPQAQRTVGEDLPPFLSAASLKPFISDDLRRSSTPIVFAPKGGGGKGGRAFGYEADLLPQICNVYLEARRQGALVPQQMHIADTCEMLMRALARVGIIALVDEATGYQEVRDRLALQDLLDRYLRKELAAWAKRFPDEFYKEMFRLRGWRWPSIGGKRPGIVGTYTNDLVYERLAPGILQELETRNPKDERGRRKAHHHSWLTEDVGHPALAQHLHAVIGFMRASASWDQFYRLMNRAFPRKGETIELAFED
jgi:hypothetical protein